MATRQQRSVVWIAVIVITFVVLLAVLLWQLVAGSAVVVPNVIGEQRDDAVATLEASGLEVGAASEVATGSIGPGFVLAQSPQPGDRVSNGSSVDLTLAVSPGPASVPDVTGLAQDEAIDVLEEALFVPEIVRVFETDAEDGTVAGQLPRPGTEWTTGTRVAVGVESSGQGGAAVVVPDLIGRTIADGAGDVMALGLEVEGILVRPDVPEANAVREQVPPAGVLVEPGTTIYVLLDIP